MGSMSNPNPWSPYDSYNDCSQGICNMYCPQWCYFIFPPPPPSLFLDDSNNSSSSNTFSPLLIALIGILVSAFMLVSYYTLISKYCHRHHSSSFSSESPTETRRGDGLNDSLIKSIKVYKYKKGDGFVDCSDCSVCLSEFEENESLRLLPKCNHAFHLPCIDTWLKSHSNCPLCRAFVTTDVAENENAETGSRTVPHRTGDSVIVVQDLDTGSPNPKPPEIRRSVSLNSSGLVVSIEDGESAGLMKRSVSTGRFIFSRSDDRGGPARLPN